MRTPARFKGETRHKDSQEKKANVQLPCMAVVGDGTGGAAPVGAARPAFYWIQLYGDTNRVTQCYCPFVLTNGDIIFVRRARDRSLSYYEFVELVQTAAGGVVPPVAVHNHGSVAQGGVTINATIFGGVANVNAVWTHTANLVLNDGAGDSPQLQFVGGTNADTAILFLDDVVTAGQSDLIIRLVGTHANCELLVQNTTPTTLFSVDAAGDVDVPSGLTTLRRTAGSALFVEVEDAATNSVTNITTLYHDSTNVPAVGFGGRLLWELRDTLAKEEAIAIDGVWDDPTGNTEDAHMAFLVAVNSTLTEIARVDGDGIDLVAGADVYPEADGGGLFQRNVDHWFAPTDHFNAFVGYAWQGAPWGGAPNTVDVATYPSLLFLRHNAAPVDFFASQAATEPLTVVCRTSHSVNAYSGIRADDGSDNNYVEVRLVDGTATGLYRVAVRSRVGGGGVTTNFYCDGIPPDFRVLRIYKAAGGSWYAYVGGNSPVTVFIETGAVAWTASRKGIIFGVSAVGQNCYFDWFQ